MRYYNIKEIPLDPDLQICDPHHHLWDRPDSRYMPEDLMQDVGSTQRIVKTVFVECQSGYRKGGPQEMRAIGETEFAHGIAIRSATGQYGMTRIAAGIVGFADLTLGKAVEPVLDAHIAAGENHFRGIRHSCAWDESPEIQSPFNAPKGLLLNSKFREGFAYLRKYNLVFDAWLYFHQLTELVDLAKAFPDTPIVIDHIGGPLHIGPYIGKREEVLQVWKRGIAELSGYANVAIKLGGLGMQRCGFDWHKRATLPDSEELANAMKNYYLWCIEHFGVDRCMFESNFPVDKVSYSYAALWNAFKRITKDFSTQDRAALFYDTAVNFYRL